MFRLLVATLALGAAAFQAPAAAGSRIAMSQVSSAAPLAPLAAEATTSRAVVPTMNEEHETLYEMYVRASSNPASARMSGNRLPDGCLRVHSEPASRKRTRVPGRCWTAARATHS